MFRWALVGHGILGRVILMNPLSVACVIMLMAYARVQSRRQPSVRPPAQHARLRRHGLLRSCSMRNGLDGVPIHPRGTRRTGTKKARSLSDMTCSKLVKELGYAADLQGCRSSVRPWSQEQTTFPCEVAEVALAHVVGDAAEQAYARSDLFEKRRKLIGVWAAYLASGQSKIVRIS